MRIQLYQGTCSFLGRTERKPKVYKLPRIKVTIDENSNTEIKFDFKDPEFNHSESYRYNAVLDSKTKSGSYERNSNEDYKKFNGQYKNVIDEVKIIIEGNKILSSGNWFEHTTRGSEDIKMELNGNFKEEIPQEEIDNI